MNDGDGVVSILYTWNVFFIELRAFYINTCGRQPHVLVILIQLQASTVRRRKMLEFESFQHYFNVHVFDN